MKLQRNNKYVNKIAKGIGTVLLASTILAGINVNVNADNIVKEEVQEVVKDKNYFVNFYDISKEEKEKRLEQLDIKYPNATHRTSCVATLVVKDNGNYKIIPVIDMYNETEKKMEVYDLFTEEKLFDLIESYDTFYGLTCTENNELLGHNFNNITNAIPYFNGKEIYEYGVSCYTATFFKKHLDEFKQRDNINYVFNVSYIYDYLYTLPFRTNDCFFTTYELADNYVTTVPNEFRVTSEELGLSAVYGKKENKYFDFWKENEQNIEESLSDFEFIDYNDKINATSIQTLIFKDSEDNYKLMWTMMHDKNGKLYFSDLFTGMELFGVNLVGNLKYDSRFTGIDFSVLYDAIPYFEDKKIIELNNCSSLDMFVFDKIQEFRNKDGINYKYPERSYIFDLIPINYEQESDINKTIEDYAKNYLVSVPKDMQVYSKDLKIGLDVDKVKTLN